jgi:hypothetical protein
MAQELVRMSTKELDRVDVVRRVIERRLTQVKAAELMGLTARQVRRLCNAYQDAGPIGLASRKRGQPSNRRLPPLLQAQAVEIVRERYADFGPKLAQEKLLELHHIRVAKETLRKWMTLAPTRSPSDLLPGWAPLLDHLCDRLEAVGWNRRFAQVKEKFGVLRIYFEEEHPTFTALADECEEASRDICAFCGRQGRLIILDHWNVTLCDACSTAARTNRERNRG